MASVMILSPPLVLHLPHRPPPVNPSLGQLRIFSEVQVPTLTLGHEQIVSQVLPILSQKPIQQLERKMLLSLLLLVLRPLL